MGRSDEKAPRDTPLRYYVMCQFNGPVSLHRPSAMPKVTLKRLSLARTRIIWAGTYHGGVSTSDAVLEILPAPVFSDYKHTAWARLFIKRKGIDRPQTDDMCSL